MRNSGRSAMAARGTCRLCGRTFEQYAGAPTVYCKRCRARADKKVGRTLRARCKECGKAFDAASLLLRYCSDKCRVDGRRRRVRESSRRYRADPEKRAMLSAQRRARAASLRAKDGRGGRGKGRPQRRPQRRTPRRRPAGRAAAPRSSVCRLCGRTFEEYGRVRYHFYCKRCTAKTDRAAARTLRVDCGICGKMFATTHRSVRYCSTACSNESKRRSDRKSNRKRMADPEKRAVMAAAVRAQFAARMDGKRGPRRRRRAA